MRKHIITALSVGTLLSSLAMNLTPQTAQAHHRSGHSGGSPSSRNSSYRQRPSTEPAEASSLEGEGILSTAQRELIEDLFQDNNDIIDTQTRRDIQSQIDSLPPGMQRRLARGRELPPGIAKKVDLPAHVNEYVGLDDNVRIVVVGRDAVVVDPVTELIVDVLRQVLL